MQTFALIFYFTAAEKGKQLLAPMSGRQKQTAADEMLLLVGLEKKSPAQRPGIWPTPPCGSGIFKLNY